MGLPSGLMGKSMNNAPIISGKIRPGIMVLTKDAKANQEAVRMYEEGVSNQVAFEDIKSAIEKKLGLTNAMRPTNVDYFSVRRQDFSMPEIADILLENYGEDRGEGRRLYRFPIILPSDDVNQVLDFNFKCFTRSGLQFWSDEVDDKRVCKEFAPVKMVNGKAARMAGGRDVKIRKECVPGECQEFQKGDCKMRGRLLFYVPGIPGAGMFEVPTGSKNFGFSSEQTLTTIRNLSGGKLTGLNGGKPVFWLSKKLHKDLPMIGPDGKAQRTDQWLIEIAADIDMSKIIETRAMQALPSAGAQATSVLMGGGSTAEQQALPVAVQSVPVREDVDVSTGEIVHDAVAQPITTAATEVQDKKPPATQKPAEQEQVSAADMAEIKRLRKDVSTKLELFGLTAEDFKEYGTYAFGDNWSRRLESLRAAENELQEVMQFDPSEREGYKASVLARKQAVSVQETVPA